MAKPRLNFWQRLFRNRKSISPWDLDSDVGWQAITGNNQEKDIDVLARRVPWLYRGVKDRAQNVSHMPWSVEDGTDKELANSEEWGEEKPVELEWLSNPRQLLSQLEQSLTITGRAYCAITLNNYGFIKELVYVNPNTIKEVYDKSGKVTGYLRTMEVNGNKVQVPCSRADQKPVAGQVQIVVIYDPDYLTETGPGQSSPAMAALTASGVLYSYDTFVTKYFDKGALRPSVLLVEGADVNEQTRLQHWWQDVFTGKENAFAAIVMRAKSFVMQTLGDGLDTLKDNDLSTQRRQDIATALGIPESRLWSAAANMATRKEDEAAYFRGTIIPECDLIAEAFNEQIFNDWHNLKGYRLEFQPESLDIFQEDESQRAGSLKLLTDSGIPLLVAMDQLGYHLTDEQRLELEPTEGTLDSQRGMALARLISGGVDEATAMVAIGWIPSAQQLSDIQKLREQLAPPEKPVPPALAPFAGQSNTPAQPAPPTELKPAEPMAMPMADMSPTAMRSALYTWKAASLAAVKTGHTAGIDFDHPAIPESVSEFLRYELEVVTDAQAVNDLFKKARAMAKAETVDPMLALAQALDRANDLVMEAA